MDGRYRAPQSEMNGGDNPTALGGFARDVRGAAQLVATVAESQQTPASIRAGLELIARSLRQSADQADKLADEVHIDISSNLGITTGDLANMRYAAISPPFRRQPESLPQWKKASEVEFGLWGEVEAILGEDDQGLEQRFLSAPDDHLALIEQLEKLRGRWLDDMKLVEATLLRLAVAVARWEQSDGE